jgi:pyrimidine-specific ribonucleoside hydrolase
MPTFDEASAAIPATSPGPTPVIVDCDPGVDDALALALAAASPELELRAVTTVRGNVPLPLTTRNALAVLRVLDRDDVPVAAGAADAYLRPSPPHPPLHGANGLGDVEVEPADRRACREHAVELMATALRGSAPRTVTIAAIGPLTNLALLFGLYPELASRVRRVVAMGGAVGPGNVTPVAEFNVWADPEAAHRVLSIPDLEVQLVPLDVTNRATLDARAVDRLGAHSPRGRVLADFIRGYGDLGPDGWRLHDALVIAALVDPSLIASRPAFIEVDTSSGLGRAQTICAFDMPIEGWGGHGFPVQQPEIPGRLRVALEIDVPRFQDLLCSRLLAAG